MRGSGATVNLTCGNNGLDNKCRNELTYVQINHDGPEMFSERCKWVGPHLKWRLEMFWAQCSPAYTCFNIEEQWKRDVLT